MSELTNSDIRHTALLLMDFQNGIVANFGDNHPALANAVRLRDGARKAGVPVIFVSVGFRDGYPEISSRNRMFSALRDNGRLRVSRGDADIHPKLTPAANEPRVIKRRVGALNDTDLAPLLRGLGIRHLIMAGISTSGVVLSTLRLAADMDYQCTVVADACADADEEVHRVLTEKVFPRQAAVMDTAAILETLSA